MCSRLCSRCRRAIPRHAFYCVRCGSKQVVNARNREGQLELAFECGCTLNVAVFRSNLPIAVEEFDLSKVSVRIRSGGDVYQLPASSLFEVVDRWEEMWSIG
jgi:hypothetical protein